MRCTICGVPISPYLSLSFSLHVFALSWPWAFRSLGACFERCNTRCEKTHWLLLWDAFCIDTLCLLSPSVFFPSMRHSESGKWDCTRSFDIISERLSITCCRCAYAGHRSCWFYSTMFLLTLCFMRSRDDEPGGYARTVRYNRSW